jgi:hypothetical protein
LRYYDWFKQAAEEFDVPVELLEAIAFAETRWQPMVPAGTTDTSGSKDAITVERSNGPPSGFGIMALHDDAHFGHTLREAAALLREPARILKINTRQNIRGAAALLAKYGEGKSRSTPLEQWEDAVAKFSGIPQRDIAQIYTYQVFSAILQGASSPQYCVKQRQVDLEKIYGKERLRQLAAH